VKHSRKNKPLLEALAITDFAAEGKALGRVNEQVVFVQQTIPGDVVDVQITKKRKSYMEGFPVHFHKYSDMRVEPFCKHFGICGGCKWQPLPYEKQLFYKEREVYNNLKRIGKVELPEMLPVLPSPDEQLYRNKLEFSFTNKRWFTEEEKDSGREFKNPDGVGFHVPGKFDKVVDIEKCHLQAEPSNAIRLAIKQYALNNGLTFFDLREQNGFLRTVTVRTASSGEVMVIVVFFYDDDAPRTALLRHLCKLFPDVTSWMYVINGKANDSITDLPVHLFAGRDHIIEEMEDLKFKIGAKSFFQTNSRQALNLYRIVRDFASPAKNEIVYDLYTGTGTIANFIAPKAKKVIGIEYVPEAIEDANENSRINHIDNTVFIAGDMKNILKIELFKKYGRPDVLITDPPRAGMHTDVVNTILNAAPDRIVYVSCNSATQARDVNMLNICYRVVKIQPVDMFPHTHHIENVALLKRK
jgi:23S rRNA (uracil1939-C5)-methyltransferase